MSAGSVLVVGASAAGLATAEALRRKGFTGRLTLLDAEPHRPYDRPPLSKQYLAGDWDADRIRLRTSTVDDALVVGEAAVGLDAATRTVRTATRRTLTADAVVVATGLRPRTLPGRPDLAGVRVLRSLDDATALRAELAAARRVVVVGDGVLAAEIAATARRSGAEVTMAGPQPAPLADQLGPLAAGLLADLHTARGVRLRLGTAVAEVVADRGRATGVRLADGETLPADLVVVAIGALPATDWLAGSGLRIDDGVVCDERCVAAPGIYAAGDVARWYHPGLGRLVRLENRTNATEQGIAVAGAILGADRPYAPVPYMWTDQYDARIQVHGRPAADAEVTVTDGAVADGRFVAVYRHAGRPSAVLGWNMPRQARLRRADVAAAYAGESRPEGAR
ncbi:NAD(P)/FAD-dependent oxidoreductase [Actinocatenispora rupis]|uniref:Pyridine nucleotide-disulfide oxidoreductase n=1 Tax=Actinocatenispora rupis TaxID=519421 RepID=A0A8J3J8N5_9ACTN|nr:FAD-dependent oxidoreductase [Actinocatenispora rupis]GID12159.1 pyridine nucleotide-disulfide oxidoreductase [Actinocatenispora rupis]